ncbi:unnamed protein product [Ilex paraguariensis]|uniref:Myb-like domain-containing protein n=1 Tax=Ilex paraguariensis TaxID=185542 RepID=A0ABC8SHY1_9AQUA
MLMEVFTGDRKIPTDDVVGFPDNLTPLAQTADDILCPNPTARVHPQPDVGRCSLTLPQKLRPIRCNGRNVTEYFEDLNGGLDGALMSCDGVVSSYELGFLTQLSSPKLCVGNGVPEACGGVLPGNSSVSLAGNTPAVLVQQMKSEMEAECMNIVSKARILEAELSSSSEDGDKSSKAIKEPLNQKRKRKRKTRKKLKLFLENMMGRVMQKQEQMQKQFIDMIEKKEQERIIREEAWKQQEMERAKKDEVMRAQETSRGLALISFIQNVLGHEIQTPKPLEILCPERDEGEIHNQEDSKCDPSNWRWPKSEVQALITVRTALDHKFLKGPKCSVWEEVAAGLSNMGYSRTAKKCKEKWENINKYYKRTMENGKKRPDSGKLCSYFHELDVLYNSGLISPANASNFVENEIEDNTVKE